MHFAFMGSEILPLNSISTDICADELVVPGKQPICAKDQSLANWRTMRSSENQSNENCSLSTGLKSR